MKKSKYGLAVLGLAVAIFTTTLNASASLNYAGVQMVSKNAAGVAAIGSASGQSISANGRYVLFSSTANNLVLGDTNSRADYFRKDLQTGEVVLVSLADNESLGNEDSASGASISGDGRFVAFRSNATNLLDGAPRAAGGIYLRDIDQGTTVHVNVDTTGNQLSVYTGRPSVSDDGTKVVFSSITALPGYTHPFPQIVVRNLQTTTTSYVSINGSNTVGNDYSYHASISGDGQYVVYQSRAKNLVANNTVNHFDIYRFNLSTATTELITPATNNTPPAPSFGESTNPNISTDGRYVVFVSTSQNLAADQVMGQGVYVRDMSTSTTTLASVRTNGQPLDGFTDYITPSVSDDGQQVVFQFRDSNWQSIGQNSWEVYLRNREASETTIVSYTHSGQAANAASFAPAISRNAQTIVYHSNSTNRLPTPTASTNAVYAISTGIDTQAPFVTGTPDRDANGNNWYNAPVTIDWQATDPEPSSGAATDPANTVANLEGTHTYTSQQSCDPAGNCATGSLELSIDTVAPVINFENAQSSYGATDTINISCTFTDATSGVDTSDCGEISNQPAYLYLNGGTVNASATDLAGNQATAETSFTVSVSVSDVTTIINQLTAAPFNNVLTMQANKIANANTQNQKENFIQAFGHIVDAAVLNGSLTEANGALLKNLASQL